MPQTQGQNICHSSGGGKSKAIVSAKLVSPEASSMACRQLPSRCVLTWPLSVTVHPWVSLYIYCSEGTGQPHPYDLTLPSVQFSCSVVSDSEQLHESQTPGLPVSITNSQSSLRLTSIESVMPSSHLILCRPFLLLPTAPPSIRVVSNESTLRMRWPK